MASHERRMDFVRFTGEWGIYYVLIALLAVGRARGVDHGGLRTNGVWIPSESLGWVLPSAAAGAVIVAAWLVESKQRRSFENMAPVLAMIFTCRCSP